MQVLPASAPTSGVSYTERARRHKDGSVVLSIADDRICKLNGVGALTWMILEERPAGLSVDELVRELSEQFETINAECQLRYEVSREQLLHDTSSFLIKLKEMNLLRSETGSRGELYYIRKGISGTTSRTVSALTSSLESGSSESTARPQPVERNIRLLKRETFIAFIGLLMFDLLLKFCGFASVIKKVERWPIAALRTRDLEVCKRVRAMVDRAQMYYPKKAMCLQHSAVVTCLLRRRGVRAEMVLAAQEFPPKAHAWAEVGGEVVNDSQRVKTKYLELRRV